jgi:hypothetical protein
LIGFGRNNGVLTLLSSLTPAYLIPTVGVWCGGKKLSIGIIGLHAEIDHVLRFLDLELLTKFAIRI